MLWFYTRDNETLKAETRFDNETRQYELTLHWPDGRSQTERFPNAAAFQRRLDALKEQLETERWHQGRPPVLLQDGWRDDEDEPVH